MSNITHIYQANSPDGVLEAAKGQFDDVVVVGLKDGRMQLRANNGMDESEVHLSLARAQAFLVDLIEKEIEEH